MVVDATNPEASGLYLDAHHELVVPDPAAASSGVNDGMVHYNVTGLHATGSPLDAGWSIAYDLYHCKQLPDDTNPGFGRVKLLPPAGKQLRCESILYVVKDEVEACVRNMSSAGFDTTHNTSATKYTYLCMMWSAQTAPRSTPNSPVGTA